MYSRKSEGNPKDKKTNKIKQAQIKMEAIQKYTTQAASTYCTAVDAVRTNQYKWYA